MKPREEQWRDIAGYEGKYQVSTEGRVRSLCYGKCKILKPYFEKDKARIVFCGRDTRSIPRLVFETFVGPLPPHMIVYQKDGDITNTALRNLAVATRNERFRERARRIGGPNHRPVLKITTGLEVVAAYRSAREAAKANGFPDKSCITRQCNLEIKSSVLAPDGYIYAWDEDKWLRKTLQRARAELDALGIRYNDPCTECYYDLPAAPDLDLDPDILWNEAPACGGGGYLFGAFRHLIHGWGRYECSF